jgi:hypothetical protein
VNVIRRLVVAIPILVLVAASCGGGDDLVEPTVVGPVAVDLSSTVPPSPTTTVSSTLAPQVEEPLFVDLANLIIPVCRTTPFAGGSVGFGTVPRAPEGATTSPSYLVNPEVEIIVALAPVIRRLDHFTAKLDSAWYAADSERDFVTVLSDESRRLWLLCGAVAVAAPDLVNTHPVLTSLRTLLSERQAWLTDRLEVLRTTPDSIRDDDASRAATSEALKNLTVKIDALAVEAGVEDRITPVPFTVPNPLLEVSLDLPAGWLLIRNRIDIVLAAPPELQAEGVSGLGVPGWNFGTALRIKRLRHEAPWTLSDTAELMDSLLIKFGDRVRDETVQVDGLATIARVYDAPEHGWVTFAAATVRDLHTYLFEFGCPSEERVFCESQFLSLIDDVRFSDS